MGTLEVVSPLLTIVILHYGTESVSTLLLRRKLSLLFGRTRNHGTDRYCVNPNIGQDGTTRPVDELAMKAGQDFTDFRSNGPGPKRSLFVKQRVHWSTTVFECPRSSICLFRVLYTLSLCDDFLMHSTFRSTLKVLNKTQQKTFLA